MAVNPLTLKKYFNPIKKARYFIHGSVLILGSAIISYTTHPLARIFFHYSEIFSLWVIALITYFFIFLIFYLFLHEISPTCIISSIFMAAIFYPWILNLLVLGCVVLGIFLHFLVSKKVTIEGIHVVLNMVIIIFYGFYYFSIFQPIVRATNQQEIPSISRIYPLESSIQELEVKPDIYYIILDSYGQADMLKSLHGYDNSDFILELQNRDFFVASKSQSNYPKTLLSLASSLNLQYLDQAVASMEDSNLWWPLTDLIQESQVRDFLREEGYTFVNIAGGWDYTDIRNADTYLKPFPIMLNDLQEFFIASSSLKYLGYLDQPFIAFPSYKAIRRAIKYPFEIMPEVTALPGEKFIFIHVLAPHPPFVFNEKGEEIIPDYPLTLDDRPTIYNNLGEYRAGYFSELEYINQITLAMIDAILAQSKTPPIIIIQADHGPAMLGNYDEIDTLCVYERFSILNAYYLPSIDYESIPDDISPVNSFRLIFNKYFGTGMDILPNQIFFSSEKQLYKFIDVSSKGSSICTYEQ